MIECSICNKGPFNGVSLFRLGEKGDINAEWRCRVHMSVEQKAELDPDVDDLVSILESEVFLDE